MRRKARSKCKLFTCEQCGCRRRAPVNSPGPETWAVINTSRDPNRVKMQLLCESCRVSRVATL